MPPQGNICLAFPIVEEECLNSQLLKGVMSGQDSGQAENTCGCNSEDVDTVITIFAIFAWVINPRMKILKGFCITTLP
jgi:hypothetical protein